MIDKQGILQSPTSMVTTIGIDWISVTAHESFGSREKPSHPLLHDWVNWELTKGTNGYDIGAKHNKMLVTAYSSSVRKDMGHHTIYSGKALAKMKEFYGIEPIETLKYHLERGHNITRIDLNLDFFDCDLHVQDFIEHFMDECCETRLRSASQVQSLTHKGHTFYIGSTKKRKKLVRIYDKGAESGVDRNWTRIELQLMGKPATELGLQMVNNRLPELVILGAIKNVVHFPYLAQWRDVFSLKESVALISESANIGDTRKWLTEQVFKALAREISMDFTWWTQYKMALENVAERMNDNETK